MRKMSCVDSSFACEAEKRRFSESHDSTGHVEKAEGVPLPSLRPSTTSIWLRLPASLLERIKFAPQTRRALPILDQPGSPARQAYRQIGLPAPGSP